MRMLHAIPALPVRDIARSVEFYRDRLGFALAHLEGGFAIFRRDAVELHLWSATDEGWRDRAGSTPVVSGAESFIAGTASCRVGVDGVDDLHRAVASHNILHPNAPLRGTSYGTREFGVLDPDNNLIAFFERS